MMPHPVGESESDVLQLKLERYGRLKSITDDLLFSDQSENYRDAAVQLHVLFSEITLLQEVADKPQYPIDTILPTGEALSPQDAAQCILDFARTSEFLQGIYAALLEAQKRFSQRPIEILYAGCGPFAPLAVPLATQFTAAEIRFTLLDVHDQSLECAQQLFRAFGLDDFARDFIQADAACYVHHSNRPLHMVITETMQRALLKEPQVAIVLNLAPQLCPGGILIPEKVAIDACLFDLDKEFSKPDSAEAVFLSENGEAARVRIELGQVLEITADSARQTAGIRNQNGLSMGGRFSPVVLDVPQKLDKDLNIMLRTTITVFGSAVLQEYDSGLTYPAILHELGSTRNGSRIEFQYVFDKNPRFIYEWVD